MCQKYHKWVHSDIFAGNSADSLVFPDQQPQPRDPVVRERFTLCAFTLSSSPATHAEKAYGPGNA
jgi:hypothetical protein